jgi:hypothetical protein
MRYFVAAVIAAWIVPTASYGQGAPYIHSFGAQSCGVIMDDSNSINSDPAAIDVWIRKWCEQNPTKTLAEAASAFILDQRKEYLRPPRQQTR